MVVLYMVPKQKKQKAAGTAAFVKHFTVRASRAEACRRL